METDIGHFMPFRTLTADPKDMMSLAETFDAAWIEINRGIPIAPQRRADAQSRLGEIIIAMWKADPEAPIIERAVAEFNSQRSMPPPAALVLSTLAFVFDRYTVGLLDTLDALA